VRFPTSRLNAKKEERHFSVPLPRKTSCVTRVALQRCPALHMSKRKLMVPIIEMAVKEFGGAIMPLGWCYSSVTVVLKVRATGALSP